MKKIREISISEVSDAIDMIGKEWMMIGAPDGEGANAMTASWGTIGVLWNKPVCVCYIRPQRYTYELAEKSDRLSFSFFGKDCRDALAYCGRHSGRDGDKLSEADLDYVMSDGVPVFERARLTLVCKKLYADFLRKENFIIPDELSHYPTDDFHKFYICEIEKALIKE